MSECDEVGELIEYELSVAYEEETDSTELVTQEHDDGDCCIEEEHLEMQEQEHFEEQYETQEQHFEIQEEVYGDFETKVEGVEERYESQEGTDGDQMDAEYYELVPEAHEVREIIVGETAAIIEDANAILAEGPNLETIQPPRKVITKGPRRFLLYDSLIAEVVDYDEEDGAPIVEFSMCHNEEDDELLPVECGICPDVMHKKKLDKHLKTHHKPGTKRYMCIYCDENFVSRAYAAGHARRHMGIRPYVCSPCKLYYCTKQDLRVHQQRRHWAKEHICEQCGKTFAQNTSLKNHRILVHEQQRRFECEHCGKRFLRNYAMKEHVRNVHLGDRRPLDCPFCDMRFRDTHKLAQHRKDAHLKQSLFECRVCGLEFTHIDFFDAHRRSLQCRKKYKQKTEQTSELQESDLHQQQHQLQEAEQVQKVVVMDSADVKKEQEEFLYEITVDNL